MEVFIAPGSGFCFGVKRAIKMAEKAVAEASGEVYTLGYLIHNSQVVKRLEEQGIKVTNEIDNLPPKSVLILRSHGVGPSVYSHARRVGLKVVDATCPKVKKIQKLALELKSKGYTLVIVGDKNHPEVKSIIETVNNEAYVIDNVLEAKIIPSGTRVGLITQTTQTLTNLESIASFLVRKAEELRIYNTLCDAVSKRQSASLNLAKKADIMLVVGGYNSANTACLAQICHKTKCETHHIEEVNEIDPEWFKDKTRIGITAGASTPPWVIEEVKKGVISMVE